MSEHDCATCQACLHDGHKCCGCYDGACCQPQHAARWRGRCRACLEGVPPEIAPCTCLAEATDDESAKP